MILSPKLIRVFSFFIFFSFAWGTLLPVDEQIPADQVKQLYAMATQHKELSTQKYEYYTMMISEMYKQMINNTRNIHSIIRLDILSTYAVLWLINPEWAKKLSTPFIVISIIEFLLDKGFLMREIFQYNLHKQQKKQMEIEQVETKSVIDQATELITQLEQQQKAKSDSTQKRSVDELLGEYLTVQNSASEMKD